MFEQARALAPDDPGLVSRVALSGIGTGDVEGAMSGLAEAVDKGKGGGGAAMLLAVLEIKAKRAPRAVTIMEAYTQKSPRDPKGANLLGVARAAAGDLDGARQAFEICARLAPGYFPPIYNLARIDLARGDAAAAQARLEAVVAKDPRADTALFASVMGDWDMTPMAAHFVKPARAVTMTFSLDPQIGPACDSFNGPAIAAMPTTNFMQTASLR